MYNSSTQRKHWLFKNKDEIEKLRKKVNQVYCTKHEQAAREKGIQMLTADEEHRIVQYYLGKLIEFCRLFNPPAWAPLPKTALVTAVSYYKRFYLQCSAMEYHPKDMFLCCTYLAFKVDEYNLTLDQFVHILAPHLVKPTTDYILSHELLLLQKLNFHLTIHSPFRPLNGFILDIKTRAPNLPNPDQFRKAADRFLMQSFSSDMMFLYPPSQIALAALWHSAKQTKNHVDGYILSVLLNTEPPETTKTIMDVLQRIEDIVLDARLPEGATVAPISKKLQQCLVHELNPSKSRKRKSEEVASGSAEKRPKQDA